MKNEIIERLNKVFRDVFDDESICVNENTTSSDIDGWDSLTHMTLIMEVEDEFNIKFSVNDIVSMKNVGEMIAIIENQL